jgi:hypothetical protein
VSSSSLKPPAVEPAPTPLSPKRLAEIVARVEAAEDGWHVVPDGTDPHRFEIHGDGPTVVAVFGGDSYPVRENAEFAAHARQDVPALLAEVDRLRLKPHERLVLRVALDMADEAIADSPIETTDADRAAMAKLRALSTGPTVAYRNPWQPGVLLCVEHGEGWEGMKPLSVEDLPNGGTCTAGDPANPDDVCGRNVLAAEAGDRR